MYYRSIIYLTMYEINRANQKQLGGMLSVNSIQFQIILCKVLKVRLTTDRELQQKIRCAVHLLNYLF